MLVHKKELLIPTVDEGPGEINCLLILYTNFLEHYLSKLIINLIC